MEQKLIDILGYRFKDDNLLKQALTHPSASVRSKKKRSQSVHFERLEFLGDRVLGLVMALRLYSKYPDMPEGELAQRLAYFVSRDTCKRVGEKIGLEPFIKYSMGDFQSQRSTLLGNTVEAVIGAMYLDEGLEPCTQFIDEAWAEILNQPFMRHAKTLVQEWSQKRNKSVPQYSLVSQTGADHSPTFVYKVFVPPKFEAIGSGDNRREAEEDAAQNFIKLYIKSSSCPLE